MVNWFILFYFYVIFALSAISSYLQFALNTSQFHNMRGYYETKPKYINTIYYPK